MQTTKTFFKKYRKTFPVGSKTLMLLKSEGLNLCECYKRVISFLFEIFIVYNHFSSALLLLSKKSMDDAQICCIIKHCNILSATICPATKSPVTDLTYTYSDVNLIIN